MRTRADAVALLQSLGLQAQERNWSFGESIVVGVGESEQAGIRIWSRMVCIAPEGATWRCYDLTDPDAKSTGDLSLEGACYLARDWLLGA